MQFEFKNLGTIKEAQIEMGDLTIICGENNTGKTYLTYAVWGIWGGNADFQKESEKVAKHMSSSTFIDLEEMKESLRNDGIYSVVVDKEIMDAFNKIRSGTYEKYISDVFAVDNDYFDKIEINVINSKKTLKGVDLGFIKTNISYNENNELVFVIEYPSKSIEDFSIGERKVSIKEIGLVFYILFNIYRINFPEKITFKQTFLLPAQRDSIELFYKALDEHNAHTLKELQRTKNMNLLEESPRFPQPIEKLIDFARDLTRQVIKTNSFIQKEHPELLQEIEEILGVKYEILGDEVVIKDGSAQFPAYMASTSVRSLMHLYFWLKHKAQKGDLLMIDEPELNLHPKNQIRIARLFAKLINVGVKIWITTHSDYIIKELIIV